MPTWVYEARDKTGRPVKGTREAANRQDALEALRADGLFLTRLEVASHSAARAAAPAKARAVTPPPAVPSAIPSAARPAAAPPPGPPRKVGTPIGPVAPPETPFAPRLAADEPAPSSQVRLVGGVAQMTGGSQVAATPYVRPAPRPGQTPLGNGQTSADAARLPTGTAAPPIPPKIYLRASGKDMALYFRQIAAMINAGTSIGQAMHTMAENASRPALRQVSREIESRVMSGQTFSSCMEAFPGLFSLLQVNMVMAGERGGFLDRTFERLALYCERDYNLQQTIKRETFYPKLQFWASIYIPGMVPLILGFMGHGNPWMGFFLAVGRPTFIVLGLMFAYRALSFASPLTAQSGSPRAIIDGVKLYVPIGGKVARGLATAKFCRALGALYSAGVGPGESVRLAANACGNAAIGGAAIGIIPKLEHGERLTESLAGTGYFPGIAIQMLRTGEDTGALDEQLDKAADFLEMDAETAIRQLVQILPILLLLFVAGIVLKQAVDFYSGYFDKLLNMGDG